MIGNLDLLIPPKRDSSKTITFYKGIPELVKNIYSIIPGAKLNLKRIFISLNKIYLSACMYFNGFYKKKSYLPNGL